MIASEGNLSPGINANRSLRDQVGQSSGKTYQMSFDGTRGFVVVQPDEELPQQEQG